MKLATLNDGTRDGQLVLVSRDLRTAHFATAIATRLQVVLDDWNFMAPQLEALSSLLNQGRCRHAFAFDPTRCMAPLPRAFQCVGAWPGGAQPMAGDVLLGAADDLLLTEGEGEGDRVHLPALAAYTGDLPRRATREQLLSVVRLHALAHLVLWPPGRAKTGHGSAVLAPQPSLAFSPVAVTPDEWLTGRPGVSGARSDARRGELSWRHRAASGGEGAERRVSVGAETERMLTALIGEACRDRAVRAGSVFAVAMAHSEVAGMSAPTPPSPLQPGDRFRIELLDAQGASVFGAIEHKLIGPEAAKAQN